MNEIITGRRRIGFGAGNGDGACIVAVDNTLFFNDVLGLPPAVRIYYVRQLLRASYPDRAILEPWDRSFYPTRFARAGGCRLTPKSAPFAREVIGWNADEGRPQSWMAQAWLDVEWEETRLELVVLHCNDMNNGAWYYFILADTMEDAERFYVAVRSWTTTVREEILVFDGDDWEKDERLFTSIKGASLDSLVLAGTLKEDLLADASSFFAKRATYEEYDVPWKRGILLTGPPGNGKTYAVRALVNALGQPCLYVKRFRHHCGPDEESMGAVFAKAREVAPCVLVFEDLDSLVTEDSRAFLLNELDGFAGNNGILTLATSNHPEKLDPALADRPGRFDRTYCFDPPGPPERRTYLERWNDGLKPEMRVDDEAMASAVELTDGFSFAYLKELCLSALLRWMDTRGAMSAVLLGQVRALQAQRPPR